MVYYPIGIKSLFGKYGFKTRLDQNDMPISEIIAPKERGKQRRVRFASDGDGTSGYEHLLDRRIVDDNKKVLTIFLRTPWRLIE